MLYIVRGIPGSGKSTYAKTLGCPVFEADMFFIKDGKYNWNPRLLGSAHNWCKQNVSKLLSKGKDVAVANTFIKLKHIQEYIDLAKKYDEPYQVIKIVGDHKNVHSVPDETVKKMKANWEDFNGEKTVNTNKK